MLLRLLRQLPSVCVCVRARAYVCVLKRALEAVNNLSREVTGFLHIVFMIILSKLSEKLQL